MTISPAAARNRADKLDALRLRSNRDWTLVLLDRLPDAERAALGRLAPDTYGILIPPDADRRAKAVGPDTALLFLTLREPAPIPAYVRAAFGADVASAVMELVADDILQIEINGRWIGGPCALDAVPPAPVEVGSAAAAIVGLALRMAVVLPGDSPDEVASFLYRFGSIPLTPPRARAWADPATIRATLGLDAFGRGVTLSADRAWWVCSGGARRGDGPYPKLYVGVALDSIRDALERMAPLWRNDPAAPSFKVAASASGLHRTDRLVVYPASAQDAEAWGRRLADVLAGLPGAIVPFAAPVAAGGVIWEGADPPDAATAPWLRRHTDDDGSWRGMVTRILAEALVASRRAGAAEPWRLALERARLSGIDTDRWTPSGDWWAR